MPRLFVVAGEASGDAHGAGVLSALRRLTPEWEIHGLGGPQLQALSPGIENWTDEAAVVGLWEVVKHYAWFRRKFDEQLRRIDDLEPEIVLLIDYPGFNLRLARALHEMRPRRQKVVYFISPQVWAWNRRRIPKMARWLDLMLCIFPFEAELYNSSGLRTQFVGHPLLDHLGPRRESTAREPDLVGLFPGSRKREVARHFPLLLEAARLLRARHPHLRFAASAASASLSQAMREAAAEAPWCEIETGTSHQLMQRATVGAVASGTATLEAAFFGLPYCLFYKVAWPTYAAGRLVIRVPFLGIVNILAGREVVRELIQQDATAESLADELDRLLTGTEARQALQEELSNVIDALGGGGAYDRAAQAIAQVSRTGTV